MHYRQHILFAMCCTICFEKFFGFCWKVVAATTIFFFFQNFEMNFGEFHTRYMSTWFHNIKNKYNDQHVAYFSSFFAWHKNQSVWKHINEEYDKTEERKNENEANLMTFSFPKMFPFPQFRCHTAHSTRL